MRYFLLLLITFLILVPPALAQDDTWTEQEADNFAFRLPPEWSSATLDRAEGELLAFQRGSGGGSRLSITATSLDKDVDIDNDYRRDIVEEVRSSGRNVQDSAVIETSTGNAVWVRFTDQSINGVTYVIADETHAYQFTLRESDAITTQDQAMMGRIINTVRFENPRSDDGVLGTGRDFGGRWWFWVCCCVVLLPFLAFNVYLFWERQQRLAGKLSPAGE